MNRSRRDAEFTDFVTATRESLLRTACMVTAGDRWLAEDVVQNALARMYVAWPGIRTSPAAYARRAVVTTFLEEVRRPSSRRETVSDALPERATGGQPYDDVDRRLDSGDVREAMAALAPRLRAVVVLRHELDLSIAETARLLGCRQGTVKSMNAKALDHLRGALAVTIP